MRGGCAAAPRRRTTRCPLPPGRSAPRTSCPARSSAASSPLGDRRLEAVALGERRRRERPAPAREAGDQRAQRVRHGLEEGRGHATGRHRAERVAVAAGVLGRDQAILAADPQAQRAPLASSSPRRPQRRRPASRSPSSASREVADPAQQVVQGVRPAAALAAELQLDLLDGVGVEQVAQLVRARELAQQVAIERERRHAPLGGGRVVLVEVLGDVLEVERGREGRRRLRLDGDELAAAVAQAGEQLAQRSRGRSGRRAARGRSRAGSGTSRSARRPPAATARAGAAATAACAGRVGGAGSAGRARRSRGSAHRTATSRPARRRRDPRCGRGRSRSARRAGARPRRAGAG